MERPNYNSKLLEKTRQRNDTAAKASGWLVDDHVAPHAVTHDLQRGYVALCSKQLRGGQRWIWLVMDRVRVGLGSCIRVEVV